jgi:hypothetical protein
MRHTYRREGEKGGFYRLNFSDTSLLVLLTRLLVLRVFSALFLSSTTFASRRGYISLNSCQPCTLNSFQPPNVREKSIITGEGK